MHSSKGDLSTLHYEELNKCKLSYFFKDVKNMFKPDELGCEIVVIAVPAFFALTADPLASLVDTAFIGRLGAVELAGVGVSIAIFNLISKLLNYPVLNLTTSLVAEEAIDTRNINEIEMETDLPYLTSEEMDAFISVKVAEGKISDAMVPSKTDNRCKTEKRKLPAVSTALIVGSVLGIFELILLILGCGLILKMMGVPVTSNMRIPAQQYLRLRAIGCPAVIISLVVQGVFRGFKDTRTPLFATAAGNIVNMVLVPILMFSLGYGVSGSAVATVISQYLIALILLFKLSKEVSLLPPKMRELRFGHFLKNGALLLVRSAAAMLTLTLSTSLAARIGAIPMAAHQICMQVWLATSLLSDSIALAAQTIIASALAKDDYNLAKTAAYRTIQIGFVFGIILSFILGLGLSTFLKVFTNDARVMKFLALGIPFVATTQPINAVAFVFDGLFFGSSDFEYAAYSMVLVAVVASGIMFVAASMWRFIGIWIGLTALMSMRMLTGFLRVGTGSGPWKFFK